MSTITLRSVKGSGLTNAEIDANFTNLNTDKLEAAAITNERSAVATLTNKTLTAPTLTTQALNVTTNNLPAIRPSLDLDFANSQTVDPRITFTRASTATRTNARGLIEAVGSGVPRIDFDVVTGACKGLLIEEQRTNLLTYSEQFDNVAYSKTRATVTANATTAPDGTLTADKMVEDATASASHLIAGPVVSTVAGTAYSLPIYIKAAERSWIFITGHSSSFGAGVFAFFNAATGAVGVTAGCTATCTPVGNGWFRASITATATVTGSQVAYQLNLTIGDATYSHTGDGTSGLYIWGAQLEAGAFPTSYQPSTETFTGRASTATFIGSNGLLQTAASGVARLGYNPLNLTVAPKLLLEAAGTNLLTYSESFDNAAWSKASSTISANATTAPDGTVTADKITPDTASTNHYAASIPVTISAGASISASAYVQASGYDTVRIAVYNTGISSGFRVDANLGTGTGATLNVGTGSTLSYAVTPVGAGWYKVSISGVVDASSTSIVTWIQVLSAGATPFAGNGTSGIFIWGAQLEASPYATSYIPTTTTQVTRVADTSTSAQTTRVADVASMTGANFSSWYRQDEGSFVSDTVFDATIPIGVYGANFQAQAAAASNRIGIVYNPSGQCGGYVESSGSTQMGMIVATPILVPSKFSVAYKVNDFAQSFNGSSVTTDSAGIIPTGIDRLNIGNQTGATYGVQHIRSLSYYPKRLTNAELQALSTQ